MSRPQSAAELIARNIAFFERATAPRAPRAFTLFPSGSPDKKPPCSWPADLRFLDPDRLTPSSLSDLSEADPVCQTHNWSDERRRGLD